MSKRKEIRKNLVDEFLSFLKEYGVIGLAVAVVIGGAVNKLTKSLAEDIIMPVIEVLISGGGLADSRTDSWPQCVWPLVIFSEPSLPFFFCRFILRKKKLEKL